MVGTFDIANFGDTLFPVLAQWRLSELGCKTPSLSPTSEPVNWQDALPTLAMANYHRDPETGPCALVIVGGGDIVHLRATPAGFYDDGAFSRWTTYAGLWAGASLLAASRGCRVAWNAPGVPEPLPDDLDDFFTARENPLAYLTVRDEPSRQHLSPRAREAAVVVPDTLAETSRMWAASSLGTAAQEAFLRETGKASPARYLTIHVNDYSTPEDSAADVAAAIDACCQQWQADAVFVCPGPVHQDQRWIAPVQALLKSRSCAIANTQSMREFAAVLAGSKGYLGSSMHGFIVSSSYGVPALAVMPKANPNHVKLRGHIALAGWGNERLFESWRTLAATARDGNTASLESLEAGAAAYLTRLQPDLDRHWERITALAQEGIAALARPSATQNHHAQPWLRTLPPWSPVADRIQRRISADQSVQPELEAATEQDATRIATLKEKLKVERKKTLAAKERVERLVRERDDHRSMLIWRIMKPFMRLERGIRKRVRTTPGQQPTDEGSR